MCHEWLPLAHTHDTCQTSAGEIWEKHPESLWWDHLQCNDYTTADFIPEHSPQVKINSTGSNLPHKKAISPHFWQ